MALRAARLPPRGDATSPIVPPTNAPVAASDCNWTCWTLRTVPNRMVDPWPTRCASLLPTATSEIIKARGRRVMGIFANPCELGYLDAPQKLNLRRTRNNQTLVPSNVSDRGILRRPCGPDTQLGRSLRPRTGVWQ